MSEKDKMLNGSYYNAEDKILREERQRARRLCFEFNQTPPEQENKCRDILNQLLGQIGKNCCIHKNFFCDYGYNIEIGDNFFSNYNLVILDCARISIGNNVFVGPNVGIYSAGHPIDAAERQQGLEYAKPISIGSDVWIGGGTSVLPGVNIGSNCVIGAGSVVATDIPDNSLAVGNPCRVIRQI